MSSSLNIQESEDSAATAIDKHASSPQQFFLSEHSCAFHMQNLDIQLLPPVLAALLQLLKNCSTFLMSNYVRKQGWQEVKLSCRKCQESQDISLSWWRSRRSLDDVKWEVRIRTSKRGTTDVKKYSVFTKIPEIREPQLRNATLILCPWNLHHHPSQPIAAIIVNEI